MQNFLTKFKWELYVWFCIEVQEACAKSNITIWQTTADRKDPISSQTRDVPQASFMVQGFIHGPSTCIVILASKGFCSISHIHALTQMRTSVRYWTENTFGPLEKLLVGLQGSGRFRWKGLSKTNIFMW